MAIQYRHVTAGLRSGGRWSATSATRVSARALGHGGLPWDCHGECAFIQDKREDINATPDFVERLVMECSIARVGGAYGAYKDIG